MMALVTSSLVISSMSSMMVEGTPPLGEVLDDGVADGGDGVGSHRDVEIEHVVAEHGHRPVLPGGAAGLAAERSFHVEPPSQVLEVSNDPCRTARVRRCGFPTAAAGGTPTSSMKAAASPPG